MERAVALDAARVEVADRDEAGEGHTNENSRHRKGAIR